MANEQAQAWWDNWKKTPSQQDPIYHNRWQQMQPTGADPLDPMFTNAQQNFGGQMQGAMNQMAGMNLANQSASMNLRGMQNQRDVGLANAWAQAYGPVMAEQVRASALGQALGLGGGAAGGGKMQMGQPQYTSNIGQGINFYPPGQAAPRMGRQAWKR